MAIRVTRLGSQRRPGEGLRLGTVRRLPRGVRKADYARLDYFDQWLPEVAPSDALLHWAQSETWTDGRWTKFAARYRREMREPSCDRLLQLLARLSHQVDFSVGCYCEDEARCHRSVLRELLAEHGAELRK